MHPTEIMVRNSLPTSHKSTGPSLTVSQGFNISQHHSRGKKSVQEVPKPCLPTWTSSTNLWRSTKTTSYSPVLNEKGFGQAWEETTSAGTLH